MAEASNSDKFAQVRGFKVEIDGAAGKEVDTAWESVSGGELIIEHVETTTGQDGSPPSPGKRSVGEITLKGPMTASRKWIGQYFAKPDLFNLAVVEILKDGSEGRRFQYYDCFPTGYVFPRMSVTNTTGNVMEEVRIKPVRCELK